MLKNVARALEDYWFDAARSVSTSDPVEVRNLHSAADDFGAFMYLPSRARNVRALLRSLPLVDPANHTFIDLGSGAGRVLFIAAEFPFRRIIGVELAAGLHDIAVANIRTLRFRGQRCHDIASVNMNAADYGFPNENLVVFLFNPFGPAVLKQVLLNLDNSLQQHRRSVFLALLYPEYKDVITGNSTRLRLIESTPRHAIFEAL